MSLATLIWIASGRPPAEGAEEHVGECWYCGGAMLRGLPINDWAGSNFNAYARAMHRLSSTCTHVCEACIYVCSRTAPVPGRPPKPGKKFGGNFRNYSHGAELLPDGTVDYINTSKAETKALVTWLRRAGTRGPWGLAVAYSGQKHVIPHGTLVDAGQDMMIVATDDLVLRMSRAALLERVDAMNVLRRESGCSADAIRTGSYSVNDLLRAREAVRSFECTWGIERGDGRFELASMLTWKDAR